MELETESETKRAVEQISGHQSDDGMQPIPLKRSESEHQIRSKEEVSAHLTMKGKDNGPSASGDDKEVKNNNKMKSNTLTGMLKGIRVHKSPTDEIDSKMTPNISISKIFQRMNPVGKSSRESFSRVFHRIGDALHKKPVDHVIPSGSAEHPSKVRPVDVKHHRSGMIGEKMFRYKPSSSTHCARTSDKGQERTQDNL